MKKLIYILSLVSILISCQKDDGLDPRPVIVSGQFVRMDITRRLLNVQNVNTVFGGTVTSPGGNVSKYELFVRRKTADGIIVGDYVKLPIDINTFPYELNISIQNLATTFNVNVADLKKGEFYNFLGYSYDNNGNRSGYNALSSVVKVQAGDKQAYKFLTTMVDDLGYIQKKDDFDNYALN